MKGQNWSIGFVVKIIILRVVVCIAVTKLLNFTPPFMARNITNVKNVGGLTIKKLLRNLS